MRDGVLATSPCFSVCSVHSIKSRRQNFFHGTENHETVSRNCSPDGLLQI